MRNNNNYTKFFDIMTQEEKAKRYDETLEQLKGLIEGTREDKCSIVEEDIIDIFPELQKSDDEKIRKEIIELVKFYYGSSLAHKHSVSKDDILAWLEKQGESDETKAKIFLINKGYPIDANGIFPTYEEMYNIIIEGLEHQGYSFEKPIDNVEPKFKVGDWIISNNKKSTYQVIEVKRGIYVIRDNADNHEYHIGIEECEKSGRLWTIQDAKNGDVLSYVTDEEDLWIMIYWSLYEPYEGHVHYHALLVNNIFSTKGTCCICIDDLKPSTKEQRDLLFSKMKEAGYVWDAENKELKKIEQQ